jgi:hypothetical protein
MADSVFTSKKITIHRADHLVVSEMPHAASFAPILPSGVTLDTGETPTATVSPDNQLAIEDLAVNSALVTDNDGETIAAEKGVLFTTTPDTGIAGVTYYVTISAQTDGGSVLKLIVPIYVQDENG